MPAMEQVFLHSALYENLGAVTEKQLRLIVLHPGTYSDEVQCDLSIASLNRPYEALSYTWGLEKPPHHEAFSIKEEEEWEDIDDMSDTIEELSVADPKTITVNNIVVNVLPNLAQALRHLRLPSEARTLWIDYLCINQESVLDRNTQVARMNHIYQSASRVIVWLGLEDRECNQALSELHGLAANVHLSAIYSPSHEETRSRIRPLVSLLGRNWFSRVWVVQEVALAQEGVVQLGKRTAPWEWFVKAARKYRDHLTCCAAVISPFNDVKETDEFLALKNSLADVLALDGKVLQKLSLHTALRLFYVRQATDPRDKVYGLLGLLTPERRLVDADYALSAEDVYEMTAFKIIQDSGDLAVLMDIDEYVGDVASASWAPDWTTNAAFGLQLYDLFSAAGSLKADARQCSPHTLNISAVILDTVTNVAISGGTEEGDLLDAYTDLKTWEALAELHTRGSSPYVSSGYNRKDAFWQTVLMGANADRSRRVHAEEDHASYQEWRAWLEQYGKATDCESFLEAASQHELTREYNNVLTFYPATRWFFLTEDGYFGLGPVEIEEGDVVCVLAGGKMPFVLRAVNKTCESCRTDQLCYRLMGFAYVHGIMDGEVVRGIEADVEEPVRLCLV